MPDVLTPADVARLAAERGKTMRAICARAGIAQSTWNRWKAGRTSPTLAVYERIVEAIFADDDGPARQRRASAEPPDDCVGTDPCPAACTGGQPT